MESSLLFLGVPRTGDIAAPARWLFKQVVETQTKGGNDMAWLLMGRGIVGLDCGVCMARVCRLFGCRGDRVMYRNKSGK